MVNIFKGLDWKTSLMSVNLGRHWRMVLCIVIFASLSTFVWELTFPHTHWFIKL